MSTEHALRLKRFHCSHHDRIHALYQTDASLHRLVNAFSDDYLSCTARSIASGPGWSDHWRTLGRESAGGDGPGGVPGPEALQAFQFIALHLKKRGQENGDAEQDEE